MVVEGRDAVAAHTKIDGMIAAIIDSTVAI
jgi:hypothetical protein